ncbi:MAG: L-2-amino-thiazoline-4-carboxylic acid hydrolase [Gemmatimonadota bacterium]|nr:MAG: L-2-amino-thiazoline-4-carboxylic acid hydrolase [Gemmatimonadota bacterium]
MLTNDCTSCHDTIGRRELLTHTVPACAFACLGLGRFPGLAGLGLTGPQEGQHKFDVPQEISLSSRQRTQMSYGGLIQLIQVLKGELDEPELVRLLNLMSADIGRQVGGRQAQNSPDTSFQTFVQVFRPPNFENSLTHEVVEDTEKVFALEVTECVSADIMRSAGLGGEIGHAAVCNMDYYWPAAFNPNFKMERTKTLMQGDDICNHRYIDTT